jgi:hypothetical protein
VVEVPGFEAGTLVDFGGVLCGCRVDLPLIVVLAFMIVAVGRQEETLPV